MRMLFLIIVYLNYITSKIIKLLTKWPHFAVILSHRELDRIPKLEDLNRTLASAG
jgi:hypothetical protein